MKVSKIFRHECTSVVRNALGFDFHFLGVSHGKWTGHFSSGQSALTKIRELQPLLVCVEMSRTDLLEIGQVVQNERLGRWIPSRLLAKWEMFPEHLEITRYCLDNNISLLPIDRDNNVTQRIANEKLAFCP
eukprot:gene784-933_t